MIKTIRNVTIRNVNLRRYKTSESTVQYEKYVGNYESQACETKIEYNMQEQEANHKLTRKKKNCENYKKCN